jgi:hypothetical protein
MDPPLLLGTEVADELSKPPHINCTDLLDQHTRRLAEHLDLGTKRG